MVSRYFCVASSSIVLNILIQFLSVQIYRGIFFIELSIIIATLLTMPTRYFIEKNYVFYGLQKSSDSLSFSMYTFSAIVSTIIFWSIEYSFHLIYYSDLLRYLGGILGLSIGFIIKFFIDKLYIFNTLSDK